MSPVRPSVTVVGRRFDAGRLQAARLPHPRRAAARRGSRPDTPEADRAARCARARRAALPVVVDGDETFAGATVERARRGLGDAMRARAVPLRPGDRRRRPGRARRRRLRGLGRALDARARATTCPGGQASHTSLIENFFGFPDGIGGAELARLAGRQAEGFGAELMVMRGVEGGSHAPDEHASPARRAGSR